jgi:hypothetical protein
MGERRREWGQGQEEMGEGACMSMCAELPRGVEVFLSGPYVCLMIDGVAGQGER